MFRGSPLVSLPMGRRVSLKTSGCTNLNAPFAKRTDIISSVHIESPAVPLYFADRNDYSSRTHNPLLPSPRSSFRFLRAVIARRIKPSRPGRPISKITHGGLGGCGMEPSPAPYHVVAELPTLRPVSDVITLHLVHLMHPVAELRGCLAETAESVHSIFHIALLLTNRYAPLTRIHPPDANGDTGRSTSHAKSTYYIRGFDYNIRARENR